MILFREKELSLKSAVTYKFTKYHSSISYYYFN